MERGQYVSPEKRNYALAGTELVFDLHFQLLQFVGIEPLLAQDDGIVLVQEHQSRKGVHAELISHRTGTESAAQQQPVVHFQAVIGRSQLADPFLKRTLLVGNREDFHPTASAAILKALEMRNRGAGWQAGGF